MLPSVIKDSVDSLSNEQIEAAFMAACGPELKRMAYAEAVIGACFGMLLEFCRQLLM